LDYTSTRFHNTLVARGADTTAVINEVLAAQEKQRAFDLAREETLKKNI